MIGMLKNLTAISAVDIRRRSEKSKFLLNNPVFLRNTLSFLLNSDASVSIKRISFRPCFCLSSCQRSKAIVVAVAYAFFAESNNKRKTKTSSKTSSSRK